MLPIPLDLLQTIALAAIMLALGYFLTGRIQFVKRYNIPAPIVGGLLIAVAQWLAHTQGTMLLNMTAQIEGNAAIVESSTVAIAISREQPVVVQSTAPDGAQTGAVESGAVPKQMKITEPFQQLFFASLGFGASLGLLRIGGPLVVRFFLLAAFVALLQNLVGMLCAAVTGQPLLFGVLCGSVTLTGGPATGLAFESQFTAAGLIHARELALASGMGGIICGGLLGGPLGKWLVESQKLMRSGVTGTRIDPLISMQDVVEEQLEHQSPASEYPNDDWSADGLLGALTALLAAVALGSLLTPWLQSVIRVLLGADRFELPGYVGAMIVAGLLRNLNDLTGYFRLSQRLIDDLGNLALGLFIVLALMELQLWELSAVALPLAVTLLAQVMLLFVICRWIVFRLMGRDYEAAVMSGGFYGFMMGTTANAMANMRVLVERYGAAPQAFLVVPIVGAFMIDFINAMMITGLINYLPAAR